MEINKVIKDAEDFKSYVDRFVDYFKLSLTQSDKEKQQLEKQVAASNMAAAKVKEGMKTGVGSSTPTETTPARAQETT